MEENPDERAPGPGAAMEEPTLEYLSEAWLAALDEAVRADVALAELTVGCDLVIEQVVQRGPGDDVAWQVRLVDGKPEVKAGSGEASTVRFTTDLATATAITLGREPAQAAFLRGDLRIGGDTAALAANRELLAAVTDVAASLRARTTFPDTGG